MECPGCRAPMQTETLDGHLGRIVNVDICGRCQSLWFDGHESLSLTPASVLRLFKRIGEQSAGKPAAPVSGLACPRCGQAMSLVHDMQRNTRFQYLQCAGRHGRFITFFNFLREKDFIRPLSAAQVEQLRQNVSTVNCANCGGPIDVQFGAICPHCGSPLSMIDMHQAEALVHTLRNADEPRAIDPALPLRLIEARRDTEAAFATFHEEPGWFVQASSGGLVSAGLTAIAKWLNQRPATDEGNPRGSSS